MTPDFSSMNFIATATRPSSHRKSSLFEVLVIAKIMLASLPQHDFKRNTVGQAQSALSALPLLHPMRANAHPPRLPGTSPPTPVRNLPPHPIRASLGSMPNFHARHNSMSATSTPRTLLVEKAALHLREIGHPDQEMHKIRLYRQKRSSSDGFSPSAVMGL